MRREASWWLTRGGRRQDRAATARALKELLGRLWDRVWAEVDPECCEGAVARGAVPPFRTASLSHVCIGGLVLYEREWGEEK